MSSTTTSPIRVSYAQVRIEGTLSSVRARDQSFTVVTADGTTVPGWHGGCRYAPDLIRFLNDGVVFIGVGRFDRAGRLLCIAASGFFPAARPRQACGLTPAQRRGIIRQLREGFGPWPEDGADAHDPR
jgi:hypothetical protein